MPDEFSPDRRRSTGVSIDASAIRRLISYVERGPLSTPVLRVWAFSALLAATAAVVFLVHVRYLPKISGTLDIPWPALAIVFGLAELLDVQVHFRRETHAFSLSEVPAVLGLFFLDPTAYLLALLTGSGLALIAQSREHPLKIAFNLSNFAFTAMIAMTLFHALGAESGTVGPVTWLASFVAMLAASTIASTTIATAISMSGGAPQIQKLPEMIQFGSLVALANTSLALLAVTVLWVNATEIWLLVIPITTLLVAYRAYVSERE
jgi:riboflavin transporter FmnP